MMNKKNKPEEKKCCHCGRLKILYGDKKGYYCENCLPVVYEFQSNPEKTGD